MPILHRIGLLALALFFPLIGCKTTPYYSGDPPATSGPATVTNAPVENVFSLGQLPDNIRRVVLLPVHFENYDENVHAYLDELWFQAIQRQNRFEVIMIDRDTLADWSGKPQWSSTTPLPGDLRNRIHYSYQPDAILLCDVTRLESYQPLEIGLRTKLYRWDNGDFLWGIDGVWSHRSGGEVEARPTVLSGIFNFSQKKSENTLDLAAISPRYFYYHLVESVALTLPTRQAQ